MADAAAAGLVQGECDVALRAPHRVAAGPALHGRGEAAAVEQEHHLPARVKRPADAGGQPGRDRAAGATGRIAEIDGEHRRQLRPPHAARQPAHPPLPFEAALEGFECRGRRSKHEWHALRPRDPLRHVAGVITRSSRLLERGLVLLVDHDQAQPRRGGEDGAAGPHDHAHVAGGDLPPLRVTFGRCQVAVQNGHASEACAEPVAGLRSEADLGHEHDRLLAVGERLLDRLQIDLRLAAASHAKEHDRLVSSAAERFEDRLQGGGLRRRKRLRAVMADGGPAVAVGRSEAVRPVNAARFAEQAGLQEPHDDGAARPRDHHLDWGVRRDGDALNRPAARTPWSRRCPP